MDQRTRRLFFALWPDATERRATEKSARRAVHKAGGRPVPPANYHVTLVFLGAVSTDLVNPIRAAAQDVRGESFDLVLDRFGYWPKPRLLWVGPSETPRALQALVDRLWTAMLELGFERERRIFSPHVSLCRKLHRQPELEPPEPVTWSVGGFALVESDTDPRGSRYTVVEHFGRAHSVTH